MSTYYRPSCVPSWREHAVKTEIRFYLHLPRHHSADTILHYIILFINIILIYVLFFPGYKAIPPQG